MRYHGAVGLVGHLSRHALGVDEDELGDQFHWHGAWAEGWRRWEEGRDLDSDRGGSEMPDLSGKP